MRYIYTLVAKLYLRPVPDFPQNLFSVEIHGKNIIAGKTVRSTEAQGTFSARGNLAAFEEAGEEHVEMAFEAAGNAFDEYRQVSPERRAAFLERIGEEIEALGDDLLMAANIETALPVAERLSGERTRTVNQLRLFASLAREGSWVDARIDRAIPDRKPLPRPDVRRMLIPIGPVAVFSASNLPLAFSVAGGDTASALAAGCPVVIKAHPAHPATSELTALAVTKAAEATGMPSGVFSLLQSTRNEIAIAVVRHPLAKAVGFTGSLRAGRALFDAASARPNPIPVYAEMGSVNPVFLLPGALRERAETIAQGMFASVMLGGGQFCTCPGLTAGIADADYARFSQKLAALFASALTPTLLHAGILSAFESGSRQRSTIAGIQTVRSASAADERRMQARPAMFVAGSEMLKIHPELGEELFGPSTVVVECKSSKEMYEVAQRLDGHLTATVHGTAEDLKDHAELLSILQNKVGRLIFNGFPTGVEVCPSMQHGGPYPATTDSRTTSVGTAATLRFARPVAWQNFPQVALPLELRDENPLGIWRLVDGRYTKDGCS